MKRCRRPEVGAAETAVATRARSCWPAAWSFVTFGAVLLGTAGMAVAPVGSSEGGAPMPHVQEVERRVIDGAFPARYLAAAATRGPCSSWTAGGEPAQLAREAIRLAASGNTADAQVRLTTYLGSAGGRRLWREVSAGDKTGGLLKLPPSEEVEALLVALYVAGSLEARSGTERGAEAGREHLGQALVCAHAMYLRGQITAMAPVPTRDPQPIRFSGCNDAGGTGLSVYDLYNNRLVAETAAGAGARLNVGQATGNTALGLVLGKLERDRGLWPQAPLAALGDAEELLRWALRPSPLLACNLATLLSQIEGYAPAEAVAELRRERDELAAAARAQLPGPPEGGMAAVLTRLELLRCVDGRTQPEIPAAWESLLDSSQRRALAAVRFSLETSRRPGAGDVTPKSATVVFGAESSAWREAVRRDTVPPIWVAAWNAAAGWSRETWEAHRMTILVGGSGALALAALYLAIRWTVIQLRRRSALRTSFYRRETDELVRKTRTGS